jgi:hypothetical protein
MMADIKTQKKLQQEALNEVAEELGDLLTAELAAVWERAQFTARRAAVTKEDREWIPLEALLYLTATAALEYGYTKDQFVKEIVAQFESAEADVPEVDEEDEDNDDRPSDTAIDMRPPTIPRIVPAPPITLNPAQVDALDAEDRLEP